MWSLKTHTTLLQWFHTRSIHVLSSSSSLFSSIRRPASHFPCTCRPLSDSESLHCSFEKKMHRSISRSTHSFHSLPCLAHLPPFSVHFLTLPQREWQGKSQFCPNICPVFSLKLKKRCWRHEFLCLVWWWRLEEPRASFPCIKINVGAKESYASPERLAWPFIRFLFLHQNEPQWNIWDDWSEGIQPNSNKPQRSFNSSSRQRFIAIGCKINKKPGLRCNWFLNTAETHIRRNMNRERYKRHLRLWINSHWTNSFTVAGVAIMGHVGCSQTEAATVSDEHNPHGRLELTGLGCCIKLNNLIKLIKPICLFGGPPYSHSDVFLHRTQTVYLDHPREKIFSHQMLYWVCWSWGYDRCMYLH